MATFVAEIHGVRIERERTRWLRVLASLGHFFVPQRQVDSALDPKRALLLHGLARAAALRMRCAARLGAPSERAGRRALLLEAEALYRRALHAPGTSSKPRATLAELSQACARLAREVDTRSIVKLRRISAARISTAGLLFGALLCLGKWWLLPARNLALHARVLTSSAAYATKGEDAVDGHRYGQLGFHSDNEDSPQLRVDLGHATALREVRVYGRADCCFEQSLPLALELSNDETSYRTVKVRQEPFSQYEPWTIHLPKGSTARFVRLRSLRPGVLVLSELEVYGP